MTGNNKTLKEPVRDKLNVGEGAIVFSSHMSEVEAKAIAEKVWRAGDMLVISPAMPRSNAKSLA